MKLPQESRQYEDTPGLLIVSGAQAGKLYSLSKGEAELLAEFKEEDPQYSDNEGHFKRQSKGRTLGSGSPREDDQEVNIKYLNDLEESVKKAATSLQPETLLITGPDYMLPRIKSILSNEMQEKIHETLSGNFVHENPVEVLKRFS